MNMEIQARASQIRISPRKVRLVADSIKGLSLSEAMDALSIIGKRGGYDLLKTLSSAVANATNNKKLEKSSLSIKRIDVLDGPALKRFHPSTRGRVHPYKRRSTNIIVVLEGKEEKGVENGTQG